MLTEICAYLQNYFDRNQSKFYGKFEISNGAITSFNDGDMGIQEGQYFRISDSVFNDGVWKNDPEELANLKDEIFDGSVWLMAVPPDVIAIAEDIQNWMDKYGTSDSPNMSPFSSESFSGVYNYTKAQGYARTDGGMLTSWQSVYGSSLQRYKKMR